MSSDHTKNDSSSKIEEKSTASSNDSENENTVQNLNPKPENTAMDQNKLEPSAGTGDGSPNQVGQARDWRFWMVFAALAATGLLSAVEGSIISTALPTIVNNLDIGSNYAWVSNAYFLTRSVQ